MDIGNYWQENKRFLVTVGIGAAVFTGAWLALDAYLGAELRAQTGRKVRIESDLRSSMFSSADLDRAREENAGLLETCAALRKSLEFAARPEFRMQKGVPPTSRYFTVLERTREELGQSANRAGLSIPANLGMPDIAPTKEAELARYLEALDAVEQTVRLAIQAGCTRIESIRVKLDPRLLSGRAFDDVEKTQVELRFLGASMPMTRLLTLLQDPRGGRVLAVDRVDIEPARAKNSDDVKMELTLALPHLNRVGAEAEAEESR